MRNQLHNESSVRYILLQFLQPILHNFATAPMRSGVFLSYSFCYEDQFNESNEYGGEYVAQKTRGRKRDADSIATVKRKRHFSFLLQQKFERTIERDVSITFIT